ncbi:HD family phosphohydrolase [Salipaludibacillus neizhouensis]|uniref:HD family phosphohydrolase n=1 Tax=Salipaludibacillus neizhouensis TaxID=885475 RepID=A0A3A9KCI1_9BACI|nr:diguanylate cyclase [Salipaludibacillus neizhouensis]RKL68242.1 HD family phosphohydrolase [Salipaludibacillus neizhouensis]
MLSKISEFGIYIFIISILGTTIFLLNINNSFSLSPMNWTTILLLVIAIILLNHFIVLLPPKGNAMSMDSAIYLASSFVFGIELTLIVLFWSSIIFGLYQSKIVWWKHVFNFSIYSLMIIAAYHSFIYTGGTVGAIEIEQLVPYVIALLIYFALNVLLVGGYFKVLETVSLYNVIIGMVKETIPSYLSTLVLSIILGMLMTSYQNFGLILFTSVVVLLSIVFRQYFVLYDEVSKKANFDELTTLYNHSHFKEVIDDYLINKKADTLSLAFIDIDDFKKYNDYHGHVSGDELLKYFGKQLREKCEKDGWFAARYGGEEFVIILPDVKGCEASKYLNKLRKEINDSYFKGVEVLPHGCLSFSGGVVEYESDFYNSAEFIGKADQAMYRAKSEGKNAIHLYHKNDLDSSLIDYEKEVDHLEQQLRFFLYKDISTYQHSKRVFQYAVKFSNEIDLTDHEKKVLVLGALIHDIGKIEIPREIINKKTKLEEAEWEMIKQHVTWGKEIVSTDKALQHLVPLVELHHERYDGKGYPHGLKGEETPKLARILCIIDSFDAMTTERPYQSTKSFAQGIEELEKCSGTQFDPEYVPHFIEMIKRQYQIDK